MYDFATNEAGEMALVKDELVDVEQKDNDGGGWWLVKKNGKTGWAPSNYLKEVPAARAPPPAPAKRAPPVPPAPVNGSTANGRAPPALKPKPASGANSGTATPTGPPKFGGGAASTYIVHSS